MLRCTTTSQICSRRSFQIPKTTLCQFYTVPGSHSYMIFTENNWSVRTQLNLTYQRYKQALATRDIGEDQDEVLMTKYVDGSDLAQFTAKITGEMSASRNTGIPPDLGLEYGITQLKQLWFLTKQTFSSAFAAVCGLLGGRPFVEYMQTSKSHYFKGTVTLQL
ncbi:uncharacterized protein LOC110456236 [Mizuhopecten yessoensis]|uniref:uncharacterized protein LOC110456236 n=1 Tax=Mizuhopecten yessoensis TaxID=6573 RepID=UPI000B45C311|nr:uncharacterized protein LOC110456236 [Mizuhopecten yessoensis]